MSHQINPDQIVDSMSSNLLGVLQPSEMLETAESAPIYTNRRWLQISLLCDGCCQQSPLPIFWRQEHSALTCLCQEQEPTAPGRCRLLVLLPETDNGCSLKFYFVAKICSCKTVNGCQIQTQPKRNTCTTENG